MGEVGDYWREHKEHEADVRHRVARCNRCGRPAKPDRKRPGRMWCSACKRPFKAPGYMNEREEPGQ